MPLLWERKAVSLIATCRFSFCESYGIEKAQKKPLNDEAERLVLLLIFS